MRSDLTVNAVRDSLMRLKQQVDSLLEFWDQIGPGREDFLTTYQGDCDYQLGDFKITDGAFKK